MTGPVGRTDSYVLITTSASLPPDKGSPQTEGRDEIAARLEHRCPPRNNKTLAELFDQSTSENSTDSATKQTEGEKRHKKSRMRGETRKRSTYRCR